MRILSKLFFIIFLYVSTNAFCYGQENLFYILRNNLPTRITPAKNSSASLKEHFASIQILVPQAYQIDEAGIVWSIPDADVVDFSTKHAIKIMPLVTNVGFNKEKVHIFLSDPIAQAKAIESLLDICNRNHYYGLQLDFEMVGINDRDALTKFYQAAAQALHKGNYKVSFAVAPLVSPSPQPSDFLKKIYTNWQGAYDLKKLGEVADFISIMAYNQHGGITTPGPTASYPWVETAVKYVLKYVPSQKISLGIPVYSNYWFTGTDSGTSSGKLAVNSVGIDHDKTKYLLSKYKKSFQWDNEAKINFAMYQHDWLYEYIFIEDAKSFKEKLALVRKYHLRGISVFDLGSEDPRIWELL